jgi:hypothetical protein
MPASRDAFAKVYGSEIPGADYFSNSVMADASTRLPFLGDIFYLPPPIPLANVFSIGDVLIGVGAAVFLFVTMRGGERGERGDRGDRGELGEGGEHVAAPEQQPT